MRIEQLEIKGFHNLNDINCKFSDSGIIGFIGNNGSGKSSVLEGINDAFYIAQHLDTIEPSYAFDITYKIANNCYRIENTATAFFMYKNGCKDIKNLENYMPQAIFTYYAGETERLNRFAERYKDESRKYINTIKKEEEIIDFKFATAFSLKDFKLAFLVNYLFETDCFEKVRGYLGFKNVAHQVILKLKKPNWASNQSKKDDLWGAKGFQKVFYDKLVNTDDEYGSGAFARIDEDTNEYKNEIWLGLLHLDLFKKIANTPLELFIQLKALVDVDLLEQIYISVEQEHNTAYDIDLFSEGEKQLTNLIMLLTLTKDYEAIYLLDEFDAYLHPNWQREFVKLISNIGIRGQVFFTTHSPATISGLRKENVFIMSNGEVSLPGSETYNRALDEIMRENMSIPMRSEEIEKLIYNFKDYILSNDKKNADLIYNELKEKLAEDDPFFIRAAILYKRLR